jgi:hypothetical protein
MIVELFGHPGELTNSSIVIMTLTVERLAVI